jgi:hypothetical protein
LQGHSAETRNAKRTSDVGQISTAIEVISTQGVDFMSFVDDTTTSAYLS